MSEIDGDAEHWRIMYEDAIFELTDARTRLDEQRKMTAKAERDLADARASSALGVQHLDTVRSQLADTRAQLTIAHGALDESEKTVERLLTALRSIASGTTEHGTRHTARMALGLLTIGAPSVIDLGEALKKSCERPNENVDRVTRAHHHCHRSETVVERCNCPCEECQS